MLHTIVLTDGLAHAVDHSHPASADPAITQLDSRVSPPLPVDWTGRVSVYSTYHFLESPLR